jgi:tetratricopeptide (TPR) repeat protein
MSLSNESSEAGSLAAGMAAGLVARRSQQSQLDFDIEFFGHVLRRSADYVDVLRCQGQLLSRRARHLEALEIDRRLVDLRPADAIARYNLACSLALLGRPREAIDALRDALALGYTDLDHLESDADLESLHQDPEFQQLMCDLQDGS